MFTDVRQSNGFSVKTLLRRQTWDSTPEFGAWIGYCEEKGTSPDPASGPPAMNRSENRLDLFALSA